MEVGLSLAMAEAKGMRLRAPSAGLAFFLAAIAIVFADLVDGVPVFRDSDDIVRLLQIRDLLHDGAYFDLTLPFIKMPEAYVSHYSRLVDLPYYLIAKALTPLFGFEAALTAATWVWPVALLTPFCVLAVRVMRRIAPGLDWMDATLAALVLAPAILEFEPARIDHHNFQLVLMMTMLAGIVGPARRGGVAIGLAASMSIAIGLECLPFIVAALGGLALAAVFDLADARPKLRAAGASLALSAVPLALASFGPAVAQVQCDTVSQPWLVAMVAGGAILAFAPAAWPLPGFAGGGYRAVAMRFATVAVPGAALIAALALTYPQCALGHYNIVDPLSQRLWLDGLPQERGLLFQFSAGRYPLALFCVLWGFMLMAALPPAWRALRAGRYDLPVVVAVAVAAFAVFLMLDRSMRVSAGSIGLLLPLAIALIRAEPASGLEGRAARRWLTVAITVPALAFGALYLVAPKKTFVFTALDQMHVDWCKLPDASVLDRVEPGSIMATFGAAVRIVTGHPQHSVAAFTVHRAAPGMRRMFTVFTGSDSAARADALAPFDYVAICAREADFPGMEDVPLYASLVRGEQVPGIIRIEPENPSAFRLYRIDHSALP
jgi:hypothetical protein